MTKNWTGNPSFLFEVGNDIIEIARIRHAFSTRKERFLNRLFTKLEQAYCLKYKDPAPHLAGRFAAKEAIVKALGSGFSSSVSWLDIEILNDSQGKPEVFLSKRSRERWDNPVLRVSISHCRFYATAVAVRIG